MKHKWVVPERNWRLDRSVDSDANPRKGVANRPRSPSLSRSFREIVVPNQQWPEVPLPVGERRGGSAVFSFKKREVQKRMDWLEVHLVGRVVGITQAPKLFVCGGDLSGMWSVS